MPLPADAIADVLADIFTDTFADVFADTFADIIMRVQRSAADGPERAFAVRVSLFRIRLKDNNSPRKAAEGCLVCLKDYTPGPQAGNLRHRREKPVSEVSCFRAEMPRMSVMHLTCPYRKLVASGLQFSHDPAFK